MTSRISHLLPWLTTAIFAWGCSLTPLRAATITGGSMVVDFDAAALAALNMGSNPEVGALILEEFFGGVEDSSRDRNQIFTDHLVPGVTAIPTTGLVFDINGPSVTNLFKRHSQATDIHFHPMDLPGTVTGGIGFRGVMRFFGDFDGAFMMGDFILRYDAKRILPNGARDGWVLFNSLDNFRVPVFESKTTVTTVKPGILKVSGTFTISTEFANAFLNGDAGKPVGTFQLTAKIPGAEFIPIETVPVRNAGNAADSTGYGTVNYDYWIGKTEVTNSQYADFLNAVDPEGINPHDVYNSNMSSDIVVSRGGINFTPGAAPGAKYAPKPNYANKPVSYVSFYDAARFTNWLMTGDTEVGFYTFNGNVVITAEGAHGPSFGSNYIALPNENEWYKAAYHKNDGITGNYYLYPTSSNLPPTIATSTEIGDIANPGQNVANYDFGAIWNGAEGLGNVVTVGSASPYSASPYGTLDQGGNQLEWNDTLLLLNRVIRGGSLWLPLENMQSSTRAGYFPETGGSSLAFRIVSSQPIMSSDTNSPLKLKQFAVNNDLSGLPVFKFFAESNVEYRFDYSTDLQHWFRLHLPQMGSGNIQEIPVPSQIRAGGKCYVRGFLNYRGW